MCRGTEVGAADRALWGIDLDLNLLRVSTFLADQAFEVPDRYGEFLRGADASAATSESRSRFGIASAPTVAQMRAQVAGVHVAESAQVQP
jgi:hypothetical protein